MNKYILNISITVLLLAGSSTYAADLDRLAGKWSLKKVNDQDQNITQTVEVKGDKFIFEVISGGQAVLHAEGDLILEKLAPFSVARFTKIRGGQSATDLQDVDDEYTSTYQLDGDTWTLATNLDKNRDQKPSLDVYRRTKEATQSKTLVIDAIEMANTPQTATWYACFDANVGSVSGHHYVHDKGYEKNSVTIPMALELPKVSVGQKCSFKLQLDDIDDDTCTEEVDNRSTGEFTVSEKGSQAFKPESNWSYIIRWHLK